MKEKTDLLNEEKFRQKEAAEILRMSVSKICRLTQTGKIGCYRLSSGIVLYGRSHLEAFLNQSEHKAKAA
jgi:predicted site-specific integrase-resolvase